jgi:hypothetical protein
LRLRSTNNNDNLILHYAAAELKLCLTNQPQVCLTKAQASGATKFVKNIVGNFPLFVVLLKSDLAVE